MTVKRQEQQRDMFEDWGDSRHKFLVVECEDHTNGKVIRRWWEIDHHSLMGVDDDEVGETDNIVGAIYSKEQAEKTANYLNAMGRFDISHMF